MYGSLDIATSGMIAQRTRLEVITANTVNANTVRDAQGNLAPYQRRVATFTAGDPAAKAPFARTLGVHVSNISTDPSPPLVRTFDPTHPDAYQEGPFKGYVAATNVQSVVEQIDALEAARAYEANVLAAEVAKQMMSATLRLIA
jgi:flagellar basal-body rod protein FlgC